MSTTTTGRVTVFSSADCVQCKATYRALDAKGIDYRVIDADQLSEDGKNELRALGFMQLPVVQAPGISAWSGFRPDKIAAIHVDVSQGYHEGQFWTRCSCGQEFAGSTPDDADAAAYDHCFPEEVAR